MACFICKYYGVFVEDMRSGRQNYISVKRNIWQNFANSFKCPITTSKNNKRILTAWVRIELGRNFVKRRRSLEPWLHPQTINKILKEHIYLSKIILNISCLSFMPLISVKVYHLSSISLHLYLITKAKVFIIFEKYIYILFSFIIV